MFHLVEARLFSPVFTQVQVIFVAINYGPCRLFPQIFSDSLDGTLAYKINPAERKELLLNYQRNSTRRFSMETVSGRFNRGNLKNPAAKQQTSSCLECEETGWIFFESYAVFLQVDQVSGKL